MKIKKCDNGHFYDEEKYSVCPHCSPQVNGKTSGGIFSHFADKKSEADVKYMPEQASDKTVGFFESKSEKEKEQRAEASVPGLKTCPFCGKKIKEGVVFCRFCGTKVAGATNMRANNDNLSESSGVVAIPQNNAEDARGTNAEADISVISPQPTVFVEEKAADIPKEEAPKYVADFQNTASDGKTIGFFSMGSEASPEVEEQLNPVVGWLVCIKGKHLGDSFSISAGRNSIGRNSSNGVVLSKDKTVSREKHLWIIFEPKKKDFFVQPGESSGLTYINDDLITEIKKINAKDKIEIGDGLYLFVPLCGADFSWEDYIH